MTYWTEHNQGPGLHLENNPKATTQQSLNNYRIALGLARRCQNAEAIRFYAQQVKACECELRLTLRVKNATNIAQRSLFD